MNRNKFNLKDKKTKIIISSTIIIVILLFIGIGLVLSSMNNTDSKNIATQGQDKTDKNIVNIDKTDKKEEDKKDETSSKNESSSSNSGSGSNNVSSDKPSSGNTSPSKPNNGGSENKPSVPNNGGSSNSGNNSGSSKPEKPSHTHSWNPVTSTVNHPEEGHWDTVVIKEAWTEEVPVYEEREVAICNGCGADITSNIDKHMTDNILAGNMACTGWHTEWKQVQVGTNKINHPAVTEKKWVVDKAAWTETVTTGYKCSCGATK